jgi:hypothetical protein
MIHRSPGIKAGGAIKRTLKISVLMTNLTSDLTTLSQNSYLSKLLISKQFSELHKKKF